MIYTSSIIDGFKIILGSPAVHFSLLVTMLVNITVPDHESSDTTLLAVFWGREVDFIARNIYVGLLGMHALILGLSFLFTCQAINKKLSSILIVVTLMFQLGMMIQVCSYLFKGRLVM